MIEVARAPVVHASASWRGVPGVRAQAAVLWGTALAGFVLSLPEHLGFAQFMTGDLGASLACALMANQHRAVDAAFTFPYGPLALALQQAVASPLGFALLGLGCGLAMAGAGQVAIWRLRLGWAETGLFTLAGFGLARLAWAPVYGLEAAMLAWAIVLFSIGETGPSLAVCVATAAVKPSMAVLMLCGFLVVGRGRRIWRWPLAAAIALGGGLWAHFGGRALVAMLSPEAGVRNYHALGYSFFSRAYNPFAVPGVNWRYFLGTPALAWLLAATVLAAVVAYRPEGAERARWWAGVACLLGTLAFIFGFYAHRLSFHYYISLPLIGLALVPKRRTALAWAVAGLTLLGMMTGIRGEAGAWRSESRSAATAGLWATAGQRAQWAAIAGQHPLLLGMGSPEALFPWLGPVWHGYMVEGQATAAVLAELDRRVAAGGCIAIAPGWWPQAAPPAVERLRRAHADPAGPLYETYGCAAAVTFPGRT